MDTERFNQLINGPLCHPLLLMTNLRLTLALAVVVEECGAAGAAALERHCAERQRRDEADE